MFDNNHVRGRRTRGVGPAQALFLLASLLTLAALLSGCADAGSPSSQRSGTPEGGRSGEQTRGTPARDGGGEQTPKAGGGLGTPALGAADAPVVLTEYSDYQ